jgi:hypothetical protein
LNYPGKDNNAGTTFQQLSGCLPAAELLESSSGKCENDYRQIAENQYCLWVWRTRCEQRRSEQARSKKLKQVKSLHTFYLCDQ